MRLTFGLGRICEAGQHAPCPGVGDPYDEEARGEVWVCSCECHSSLLAVVEAAEELVEEVGAPDDSVLFQVDGVTLGRLVDTLTALRRGRRGEERNT